MIAFKYEKFDFDRTQKLDKMTSTSEYIPVNVGVVKYWKQRVTEILDALKFHHFRPCLNS